MTCRTLPLVAGLCCALVLSQAGGAEPESKPKLAPKYRLELEIRKPIAPLPISAEAFHDATANRLYYATADNKALAVTPRDAPAAAKETARPAWVRGFALRSRPAGEENFDKGTP